MEEEDTGRKVEEGGETRRGEAVGLEKSGREEKMKTGVGRKIREERRGKRVREEGSQKKKREFGGFGEKGHETWSLQEDLYTVVC